MADSEDELLIATLLASGHGFAVAAECHFEPAV